jgi:hypothetical protein
MRPSGIVSPIVALLRNQPRAIAGNVSLRVWSSMVGGWRRKPDKIINPERSEKRECVGVLGPCSS